MHDERTDRGGRLVRGRGLEQRAQDAKVDEYEVELPSNGVAGRRRRFLHRTSLHETVETVCGGGGDCGSRTGKINDLVDME